MDLILGCAEFNKDGYAGKPPIPVPEIVRILNLAWTKGIRTLDCANTYGTDHVEGLFNGFERLNKTRNLPLLKGLYYHYKPGETPEWYENVSVYDLEQLQGAKKAIVPMSIADTRFCHIKHLEKMYARSVFNRGKLLEEGYSVYDCLAFVRRQHLDGVIVGVNSLEELNEILLSWEDLNEKKG